MQIFSHKIPVIYELQTATIKTFNNSNDRKFNHRFPAELYTDTKIHKSGGELPLYGYRKKNLPGQKLTDFLKGIDIGQLFD